MTPAKPLPLVVALALLGTLACKMGSDRPARETVLPLLQMEAEGMKRDGEKVNPALGLRTTWNIQSVDVQEQPSDPERPWRGTVKFRLETQAKDADGSITNDRIEKSFDYLYDNTTKRWMMQYTPGRR